MRDPVVSLHRQLVMFVLSHNLEIVNFNFFEILFIFQRKIEMTKLSLLILCFYQIND